MGAPGSLNTVFTNLTIVLVTALVGPFGAAALAGYGMGARLEYLQIPLVFGLGAALVTMVGTNIGAGQVARAERVAWVGRGAGGGGDRRRSGSSAALFPRAWLGLFSAGSRGARGGQHAISGSSARLYGFFGLGLALYFASQGAGRLGWPLAAGFARLVIAAGGRLARRCTGWAAASRRSSRPWPLALLVFGGANALAVRLGAWRGAGTTTRGGAAPRRAGRPQGPRRAAGRALAKDVERRGAGSTAAPAREV